MRTVRCCDRECNICAPDGIDVDTVLKAVLLLARKHEVSSLPVMLASFSTRTCFASA